MISFKSFKQKLFRLTPGNFESLAMEVFHYQASKNPIYRRYLAYLNVPIPNIKKLTEIPFMPISFFKEHAIKTGEWQEEAIFTSSGTTGQVPNRHFVKDVSYYESVSRFIFEKEYGALKDLAIMALLPSYLEREGSSLVYMIDHFIRNSNKLSGFYLHNHHELIATLEAAKSKKQQVLLIGVAFALLDLAEDHSLDLSDVIVMETGGMKGRRKEMIRSDLHRVLKTAFNVSAIHSEYGMTELMSQAYSKQNGRFVAPPWMKVYLRDLNDPFDLHARHVGGINIIDLANVNTCSFIETQDMGTLHDDGGFEVLGRIDNSEIRGCNLLVTNY